MQENIQRPIQIFYIHRVDTRFDNYENIVKTIEPFLFSDAINFLYIGVCKTGTETMLEQGLENLNQYFKNTKFSNPHLNQTQTFAFKYDLLSPSNPIQNEKYVLEKLNSLIKPKRPHENFRFKIDLQSKFQA
ncbi:MAG: hypothetical protein HWD61_05025 [Parachlamydiaceae bacterium]|nr:MAG: hypothetical protein HWD61_05025 [Parachlamydiaceae bacterium]